MCDNNHQAMSLKKKTRNLLMMLFSGALLIAALLYVLGEFLHVDMGIFAKADKEQRFICSTVMILLTISLLPLSLRLFKFKRVSDDLQQHQASALARWGTLRLIMLGLLLVTNTFLYYAFELEASYGYLAVVTLLCMPFVIPTMSRCEAEIAPPLSPKGDTDVHQSNEAPSEALGEDDS